MLLFMEKKVFCFVEVFLGRWVVGDFYEVFGFWCGFFIVYSGLIGVRVLVKILEIEEGNENVYIRGLRDLLLLILFFMLNF